MWDGWKMGEELDSTLETRAVWGKFNLSTTKG